MCYAQAGKQNATRSANKTASPGSSDTTTRGFGLTGIPNLGNFGNVIPNYGSYVNNIEANAQAVQTVNEVQTQATTQTIADVIPPPPKEPDPTEIPELPSEAETPTYADAVAQKSQNVDASKRRRRKAGHLGTVLTGPGGIQSEGNIGKTILGG